MTTKQKPIHTVKLGLIEAAIWRNETEGKPRFNVTLGRLYPVEGEGRTTWRSTDSFGRDDLLAAAKTLDLAHTWICQQANAKADAAPAA